MATPLVSVDTQHEDMIHDAQLDYYSRKLATASSDRSVKVWDVQSNQGAASYTLAATLAGHEGYVPQFLPFQTPRSPRQLRGGTLA